MTAPSAEFPAARPLAELRRTRSSVKWTRYAEDVLPVFVAEMDWDVAPAIVDAVTAALGASDTGYIDAAGPLADAFAGFAADAWGWTVRPERVHVATDVTVGMVETMRLVLPPEGGRVVLTPPVYPPFFEMSEEVNARIVEVPLLEESDWALDLSGLAAAFGAGAEVFLLCNPQNPTGRNHTRDELLAIARLAAEHRVLVISDEVHAPLTHPGRAFTPFALVAAEAGCRSVTVTSASKGWNLAALKCAVVVANDDWSEVLLSDLPEEIGARTSLLGRVAGTAAFGQTAWLDAARAQVAANAELLQAELAAHLPQVTATVPDAGYLVWLDVRALGLGDDPGPVLVEQARIAFNRGIAFGAPGAGHVRMNIACDPSTVVEAVRRLAEFAGR